MGIQGSLEKGSYVPWYGRRLFWNQGAGGLLGSVVACTYICCRGDRLRKSGYVFHLLLLGWQPTCCPTVWCHPHQCWDQGSWHPVYFVLQSVSALIDATKGVPMQTADQKSHDVCSSLRQYLLMCILDCSYVFARGCRVGPHDIIIQDEVFFVSVHLSCSLVRRT